MSSKLSSVKDLIDQGMKPIRADLDRLTAGLHAMTASSEDPPAAALQAVRAARDHAVATHTALATANDGHIRLAQGGSQAIDAFLYLEQGLTLLEQALTSTNGSTIVTLTTKAKGLIDRANDELLAADRALGCPYGCRARPPQPKPGAQP